MSDTRCDQCGEILHTGSWPYCPHGVSHAAAIGDDIPGGLVIENLGHEPLTFYSKKAIVAEADRRGLRLMDTWAGPTDQHLTNWAAGMTEKQLRDAAVLLSRGKTRDRERAKSTPCETLQTSIRELNFGVRAKVES